MRDDVEGAALPEAVVLHPQPLQVQVRRNELEMPLAFLGTLADGRSWN